jgi:hypothetical protein
MTEARQAGLPDDLRAGMRLGLEYPRWGDRERAHRADEVQRRNLPLSPLMCA